METLGNSRGQLRVSDTDRDQAIAELSEHFQAGRLSKEEFEERTGQALQARTGKDLAILFADLPRNHAPGSNAAGGLARSDRRGPVGRYRAPIPRIAVVACAIVVAVLVSGGGHYVLALTPIVALLVVARCLVLLRRRPAWDHRSR